MSVIFQQQGLNCYFDQNGAPWIIMSPIEESIKRKIEVVGKPLKNWNIKINYGIKTGFNQAFIISTETKDKILSMCKTDDERIKTAEIIRPVLRGKDIKKYEYSWDDKWLICLFPSIHYDIDNFPTIKEYLLSFGIKRLEQTGKIYTFENGEKIKARKKTNNKWYEVQDSISYWEEFCKPKIAWNRIGKNKIFSLVPPNVMILDSMHFFTGEQLYYIYYILNSKIYNWFLELIIGDAVGGNAGNADNVKLLPIPPYDPVIAKKLEEHFKNKKFEDFENIIHTMLGLNSKESKFINSLK